VDDSATPLSPGHLSPITITITITIFNLKEIQRYFYDKSVLSVSALEKGKYTALNTKQQTRCKE